MIERLAKQLWENISSLLLAFALAFAVWISAVVAADPNEVRVFPRTLEVEVRGLDPALVLVADLPDQVNLNLSAPISLWDRLISEAGAVQMYIDLTGLESGAHSLPIEMETSLSPVRLEEIDPSDIELQLELRAVSEIDIVLLVEGEPALGFQVDSVDLNPGTVTLSGPQSLVDQVDKVQVSVDISGARESITSDIALQAIDAQGNLISGLTIDPQQASVTGSVSQAGGYRDVAVKVETFGLPASGFRVVSINVDPPIVTLFSNDVQLMAELPGFVSTEPLDLTNIEENIATGLSLDLPDGVTVEGGLQSVQVEIGVAAIESSIPLGVIVEIVGLPSAATAEISPEIVSVILSGPLSVLQALLEGDVRLIIDVSGLEPGAHLLEPIAEILPNDVHVLSVTPSTVEVIILSGEN